MRLREATHKMLQKDVLIEHLCADLKWAEVALQTEQRQAVNLFPHSTPLTKPLSLESLAS
jgi:hypothetical protein